MTVTLNLADLIHNVQPCSTLKVMKALAIFGIQISPRTEEAITRRTYTRLRHIEIRLPKKPPALTQDDRDSVGYALWKLLSKNGNEKLADEVIDRDRGDWTVQEYRALYALVREQEAI